MNRRSESNIALFFFALAAFLGVMLLAFPEEDTLPPCPEDAVLVWDGDTHGDCVTLDDFADEASIERLREIQRLLHTGEQE